MPVVSESCPSCTAPIEIPLGATRIRCPYCSTSLSIQRHGSEVALTLADKIATIIENSELETQEAIKEGSYATQTELRRLQRAQELSMVQMRLSHVQSEIRSIQRLPPSPLTRSQLSELRITEADLKNQVKVLSDLLNTPPTTAPIVPSSASKATPAVKQGAAKLPWLLFSFQGRANRSDYWIGIAVTFVIWLILASVISAFGGPEGSEPSDAVACLTMPLMVLFVWIGFAVSAKRYHDRGKAAWWVFVVLIPFIGIFWQIIELGFFAGDPGPNQYS